MRKTNDKIDDDKRYLEAAEKILDVTKNGFDKMKLEEDETLQAIVSSDIACVTLSNKRAYFRGNYFGSNANTRHQGETVNLDAINNVCIKNRSRKTKNRRIKICIFLMILSLIASCVMHVMYRVTISKADSLEATYNSMKNYNPYGSLPSGYTLTDLLEYYSKIDRGEEYTPDPYLEQRQKDMEAYDRKVRQAQSAYLEAEENITTYRVGSILGLIISGIICIITIIKIIKAREKYMVLQFCCTNKNFGLEIRDKVTYDKIRNIILVAKSSAPPKGHIDMQPQRADKIERLAELSKLYEQRMISEEEFARLKGEIISG